MAAISINMFLNQLRSHQGSLAGGTIMIYNAGTTTKVLVYLDRLMTQPAAMPYVISADGTAELFADPSLIYRIVIKNSAGVVVYDFDDVQFSTTASGGGGGGGTTELSYLVVPVTVLDVTVTLDPTIPVQYIIRNGDNANLLIVAAPVTWSFYSGISQYEIYEDGEVGQFVMDADNLMIYPVV